MKRLLIATIGAILMIGLSSCNENDVEATTENATYSTAEMTRTATIEAIVEATTEITTEATTEAYSDYEVTYTDTKGWVNVFGETEVQVVAEIENTGTIALYMSTPGCELEDKEGNLVEVVKYANVCPQIIQPGEKGYIIGVTSVEDYPGDGELNVIIRPNIEELEIEDIQYEVSDVSLSEDSFGYISTQGRITNTSQEVQSMNYVEVVFFDENHVPIGYDFTILTEEMNPNDKVGFEINGMTLPDFLTMDMIADYLIYAHPMQLQY